MIDNNKQVEKKLDAAIELLQHLVALELYKSGMTQGDIGKRIHVAKATVGQMLQGVKKSEK